MIDTAGVRATLARSTRVRRVNEEPDWTRCLAGLQPSLLQTWSWGEFKARHGWTPERFVIEVDDTPLAAAQVLVRSMGPMSVLYVPRGPAFTTLNAEVASALTLEIDRLATEYRSVIAFVEPAQFTDLEAPRIGSLAWERSPVELQPLRTIKVSVDQSDDEILAGMKSKTRYNVRLASRRGVTVRHGDLSDVAEFFGILEETSQRDEFGIHGVDYYADMLDVFGDSSALLLAEFEGNLAAGAIVLKSGDEAIYMFGASSQAYQRQMPSHLLQFEAMRWARDNGCRFYDLWGIPPGDEPPTSAGDQGLNVRSGLWGVYRFKQGFGGEVIRYPGVFERQYYPALVKLWRRFRLGPGA